MGIFVNKGIGIRIPPGGLTISVGPDGTPDMKLTFQLSLATWPYWVLLAIRHARVAYDARTALLAAADDEARAGALEAEFSSGMQAAVCSAIALDAFYADVKEKIELPHAVTLAWRKARTARFRQAAEVFRRATTLGPVSIGEMRLVLRDIFRLRDRAVHPDPAFGPPLLHPVLKVATEWRFVEFRAETAKGCAKLALSLIQKLLRYPRPKLRKLCAWAPDAAKLLAAPLREWQGAFNEPLFRAPELTPGPPT